MMVSTLDNDNLTAFIEEFVSVVPDILRQNPLTADLAGKVEGLAEEIETPFSLAVVGQMRIGKSSLMNGLIGQDLAFVGVNETTATINIFKYGRGNLKDIFRVHWKNRQFEDFPCSDIGQWAGDSERAAQTRFIEFFHDHDFFKEITLVDTPGTRSVIKDHEEIINNFLAERRERETLQHGGKADAILYVTGAVANVSSEDMLKDFQEKTRLPGSSPFNSVAVLHKWETLDVKRPFEEAFYKASLMEKQFKQFVARVIPVSGPLALAAKSLKDDFWDSLVELIRNTDQQNLLSVLDRGDVRFKKRIENGAQLLNRSALPWPCFRVVVKHAIQEGISEGENLRAEILRISGINTLMEFIEERFINKVSQIKALTALAKAIEPCRIAQLRLKNDIENKKRLLQGAVQSAELLEFIIKEHKYLEPVSKYIQVSQKPFSDDLERHKKTQVDLGKKNGVIEECYTQIVNDLKLLDLLKNNASVFTTEEQLEIRHICGGYGISVQERTACYAENIATVSDQVEERIEYWDLRGDTLTRELKPLAEHMISRLEEIAEELENSGHVND